MSVLNKVTHYQRKIERNKENNEGLIDCINKLNNLPVTVQHLEKTGIGKTINALRKIDGEVGNVAKALVWKWKSMVIEQALAEEQAEKDRRLRDPTVSSSDEKFPSCNRTEEQEPTNIEDANSVLSSTTATGTTPDVAGTHNTHEEECTSSTANQNFNVSNYENDYYDSLQPSTEREDNIQFPTNSTSHPSPLNQSSSKDQKERDGHYSHHHHNKHSRHSSKHHSSSHSRKDKPKEKKKSKHHDKAEAGGSESYTQEDNFKVKIKTERVDTDDDNEEKEEKSVSSGSSKHKHHSKRADGEHKTSERKHNHKDREQKRKHSSGYPEGIPKRSKSSEKAKKMKVAIADDDGIDCFSGASFAEALGMGDTRKKKKSSSSTTGANSLSGGSSSFKMINKPSTSTRESVPSKPELLLADAKLEPLNVEVDIASTLPEISPHYKPLPQLSPPLKLKKARPLTEEAAAFNQAVAEAILSKQQRQRTKVYSGVKTRGPIPTLYDLCVHVLKENIDALEYTGGVPYDILKPILQQATPEQLFQLEHYNPYLIEDTDELWDFHCRKEFRTGQRLPMETAREMYLRCLDEREAKLKALTCNIQQALAKSTPVRQTKLAYVDSVAKPPRNVARQQAKYGTGSTPKPIVKSGKGSSAPKPSTSTSGAASSSSQRSTPSNARVKPRMAPLMQKTMKLVKSFKR